MKRIGNLYKDICKLENINKAYKEVAMNTKNKRKVAKLREYKWIYTSGIKNTLENKNYKVGPYNVFTIYEPKERRIVSQNLQDKIVNHLVSRYILYPAVLPCLIDTNVASRQNKGTAYGLKVFKDYQNICKSKYGEYYILKCDISKFFENIDHDILKEKLSKRIKDKDALNIVYSIIDSDEKGLSIGNMTSQTMAIFYLNDLDHFIKEELKIKYYVRYQDDFLLLHPSKDYLKYCLDEIKKFLEKEKLTLNKKTRLFKSTNNFIFLGRNKKGQYAKRRVTIRKIKKNIYLHETNQLSLSGLVSSICCYESLCNKQIHFKRYLKR